MVTAPATQVGLVTRPKAKIDLLCGEAALLGCGRLTKAGEIAAAVNMKPSTFSDWFGSNADTHGSRPPRIRLAAIVRKYGEIGVFIEIEWFFEDLEEFNNRLIAARGKRKAVLIHDIDPSPSTDDWEVVDANNISKELAALYIHPPPPSNDPNTFLLPVSLSLARYPDEIEDVSVSVGLKTAVLVPTWKGCQPSDVPEHEHLKQSAASFIVQGPKPDGLLDGVVLDKSTLATMQPTSGARPSVVLELRSRRLDLEVVPDDPGQNISANRARVLRALPAGVPGGGRRAAGDLVPCEPSPQGSG